MGVSEAEKSDGENEKMNGNGHGKRVQSCFVRIGMCRALRRADPFQLHPDPTMGMSVTSQESVVSDCLRDKKLLN